jgi:hypothetical protein
VSKHQPIIYQAMNGKKPIAIRPELLETDPMHADMLRYDQAFHHPTDAWLNNAQNSFPAAAHVDTLLRIRGDEVETSMGAFFPLSHARRGLLLVESVMASKKPWKSNGHTCHLGHYQIESIDTNGTVHAGCHHVKYEAIERIRPQILAAAAEPATE